jgi:transglutaminase-like putative cysteine protease
MLHMRGVVLGAIGPSLVLFVAIGAVGEGPWLPTTSLYGLATGLYLLGSQQEHLRERRTWFHTREARRSLLAPGGAVAAVLVVAVALGAGQLLPGARSDAWFDYRDLGEGSGDGTWRTVTPLVEIRGQLEQQERVELFTVRSPQPANWRMVALDRFDGEVWGLEGDAPRVGDAPLDAPTPARTARVRQDFELGPIASRWLPAAYQPREVSLGDARVIPDSLTLVSDDQLANDADYTVVSEIPLPTRDELIASPFVTDPAYARYLELPGDFPERVGKLARDVARGAGPYGAALRLQAFFREDSRFTYDLEGPEGHSEDALETFLFEDRRGFCEQFAAAYAAMARSLGIPARVAVGFTPGSYDEAAGIYRVTNLEAHAWPELFLDGVGWTAFEPTPGRFERTPGDPTGTGREAPPPETTDSSVVASTTSTAPGGTTTPGATRPFRDDVAVDSGVGTESSSPVGGIVRTLVALVAFAALVAFGFAAGIVVAKWWRRRARRRAADPRARVFGAWTEALDRLQEAGVTPRPSATPIEFALRHAPAHGAGAAGPALMDLASRQTAAFYGPTMPDDATAREAWAASDAVAAALRAHTPLTGRMRRLLDTQTLRPSRR